MLETLSRAKESSRTESPPTARTAAANAAASLLPAFGIEDIRSPTKRAAELADLCGAEYVPAKAFLELLRNAKLGSSTIHTLITIDTLNIIPAINITSARHGSVAKMAGICTTATASLLATDGSVADKWRETAAPRSTVATTA
nr:hypothetical protein Iba_chr07fCG7660 [Ipomoea batatas]